MVGQSWGHNIKEILVVLNVLTVLDVLNVLGAAQSQTNSALEGLPRQPRTDSKLRTLYRMARDSMKDQDVADLEQ